MLAHEYDTMRSVEDDYWWYRVLRKMTVREVAKCAQSKSGLSVLDAGCGTGGTMEALQLENPAWNLEGFDYSERALAHARARGFAKVFEASVNAVPLREQSQDVVVSLDVLCCGGVDDAKAMQEFRRLLRPDGRLIMNLPAFECLRGQHDLAVNSVRRYAPSKVRELHERSGFAVERVFCWNAWLFLPIFLWRKWSKSKVNCISDAAKSDLVPPAAWLNKTLTWVGGVEASLCRAVHLPVGTSVFSVGRKKAD